jgi:hypothetical protein
MDKLTDEEIKALKELINSGDIKEVHKLIEDKKAVGRAWYLIKTLGVTIVGTIVAYNAFYDGIVKILTRLTSGGE